MTREEAKEYLYDIVDMIGTMGIEDLTEKDAEKALTAIDTLADVPDQGGRKMISTINVMLDDGAIMPERAHEDDAGLDIFSPVKTCIWRHDSKVIDTGVHVEIPSGYVGMLKSKSGLNVKHDLTGEGVIDSGYTGSIVCKLYNHSEIANYHIEKGDKIIQLVILPIETPKPVLVDSFSKSERGSNGFGSTGK